MLSKQTLANRRNGRLGGVKTEAGKAVCRHNARKHGILAVCLTPSERRKLAPLVTRFADDLAPVGAVEEALVEKLAVTYLRMHRCARAEAEYHRAAWRPRMPRDEGGFLSLTSDFRPKHFEKIARLVRRYDTSLTNQFLKLLHELERVQRRRQGEELSAPTVAQVDVNSS
jgi:hypothetical protein